jgi:MFS family permease
MIIVSEQLHLGLTQSGSLMLIFSTAVILSYIVLTPLVDRFGRKPFMVVGLLLSGASFGGISFAHSYWGMAAFLVISGLTFPFYEIGADSMVADLVPENELESAYAFSRVGMNVGFALGPLVGGFLVVISHQLALQAAGLITIFSGVAIFFMIRETLLNQVMPVSSETRRSLYSWQPFS